MPGLGAPIEGAQVQQQGAAAAVEVGADGGGAVGDGTILYIDPNDPQAAEILQQAGLRLTDDGTVTSLTGAQDASVVAQQPQAAVGMEGLDLMAGAAAVSAPQAAVVPATTAETVPTSVATQPQLGGLGVPEGDLSMPLIEDTKRPPLSEVCPIF